MQIDLAGRSALVTGSTQGIGLAIAEGLASAGARVGVNGRTEESVGRAVEDLRAAVPGADVVPVVADVATDEGFAAAAEAMPDVDVLVNNLGIFESRPALEITDEEWRRFFEVNVLASVRLTRHHLPQMMRRGWGRILYIASDSAVVTPVEMIHYGMSKTALLAVSRGFAKEAAGTGVTVNSVIAGPTHTAGVEGFVRSLVGDDLPWDEAQREFMTRHRPQSLLHRLIEPHEIAAMVTYLSSPSPPPPRAVRCGWTAATSTPSCPEDRRQPPPSPRRCSARMRSSYGDTGPWTRTPGRDVGDRQGRDRRGGQPPPARHCESCADEAAYTIGPSPTHAWPAAHIGQCSPEV